MKFVINNQKQKNVKDQLIINTGYPPQPWDIPVQPEMLFQNQNTKIEIPNTAHVEVRKRRI